jgi:hypothetical protein
VSPVNHAPISIAEDHDHWWKKEISGYVRARTGLKFRYKLCIHTHINNEALGCINRSNRVLSLKILENLLHCVCIKNVATASQNENLN